MVRLEFTGANSDASVIGVGALATRSNYLTKPDLKDWVTNVPHFKAVRYEGIYPSVDLTFYSNAREIEFDFIVGIGVSMPIPMVSRYPCMVGPTCGLAVPGIWR